MIAIFLLSRIQIRSFADAYHKNNQRSLQITEDNIKKQYPTNNNHRPPACIPMFGRYPRFRSVCARGSGQDFHAKDRLPGGRMIFCLRP